MASLAAIKLWLVWMLLFLKRIIVIDGFFGLMTYPISFDWASLLVRIATGLALLPWGLKKFSQLKKLGKSDAPNLSAVGSFSARAGYISEAFLGLCVPIFLLLGFCTRIIVIPCFVSMAMTFRGAQGEYCTSPAVIYCLLMIILFIIGSGQYSLDYLLMKSI